MSDDTLVFFGDAVKALDESGERFGGYLARFGTPETHDLSSHRDYFTAETRMGLEHLKTMPVLFHHGLDPTLDDRKLGDWQFKVDAVGLWCEGVLKARDGYEAKIRDMARAGKLGLSSGAVSHLVRRTGKAGGVNHVKSWPIYEASLTPTPADPHLMTAVQSLKSLTEVESLVAEPEPEAKADGPMCPKCGAGMACPACDGTAKKSADDGATGHFADSMAARNASAARAYEEINAAKAAPEHGGANTPAADPRDDDPAVAAKASLVARSARLVADLEVLVPLWERAVKARESEGRDLSPEKLASLKALASRLDRLVVATRPHVDPETLKALMDDADRLLADELLARL